MTSRVRAAAALPGAALLLTACQSGPADIGDGTYRAFAAAAEIGEVPKADITIHGDTLTLVSDGRATTANVGPGDGEYLLCPPHGEGTPHPLGPALTIGTVTLTRPAVFGDCGEATPERVTIVDLDSSSDDGTQLPFSRWIELCLTTDPDC